MEAKSYYERELRKYNNNPDDLRSPDEFSIDCMVNFTKEMNGKLMPEPKAGQRLTMHDVFYLIITNRDWYKGKMSRQRAFRMKKEFLSGKMRVETVERWFNKHGYKKVDVIWVRKTA